MLSALPPSPTGKATIRNIIMILLDLIYDLLYNTQTMSYDYKKYLTKNAKSLRKNMTDEERHLWYDFFRYLPITVHKQKMLGNYIVDFYCAEFNVVVELDGCQHYWEEGEKKDLERNEYLRSRGITVLRYTNEQVHKQFKNVCADILKYIKVYD
jgi:very-short-patch-repair endonuclease